MCIAEDLHNYLNDYKRNPSQCKVKNLYSPLYNTNISPEDAHSNSGISLTIAERVNSFFDSIKSRYQMSLRHGWGISEFVYYNTPLIQSLEYSQTDGSFIESKIPNQYKKQPKESYFFYLIRLPSTLFINVKLIEPHYQVAVILPFIVLFPLFVRIFNPILFADRISFTTPIGYLNLIMILIQVFIYAFYYTFADDVNKKLSPNMTSRILNNSIITFFYHLDFYLWISLTFDILKMWIFSPIILFIFGVVPAWINAIKLTYTEQIEYKVTPHFISTSTDIV
jgi:hypothetical protein